MLNPQSYIHSKVWKAGDAIPEIVCYVVLAGRQIDVISDIRSEALVYLAHPGVNNNKIPEINQTKMKALEEAMNGVDNTERFVLTKDKEEYMNDYIQSNIVENQVGTKKKKPETVK